MRHRAVLAFVVAAGWAVGVAVSGQAQAPAAQGGPYTAEQAATGRGQYMTSCSGCHGADLNGVPPLGGPGFIGGWNTRSTKDLTTVIKTTMPADAPGGLPDATYANITAFILQSNGAPAGNQLLTPATDVAINATATDEILQTSDALAGTYATIATVVAGKSMEVTLNKSFIKLASAGSLILLGN